MPSKPRKSALLRYLLLAVVATSLVTTGTLAKFSSTLSASMSMQVAAFAGGGTVDFDVALDDMVPGTTRTMQFTVQNYSGEFNCEVALNYEIQVGTLGNLPLEFELIGTKETDDENESSITVGELDSSLKAVGGSLPIAADEENGGRRQHSYELRVTWPQGESSDDYSKEIDMVTVTVTTVQVQPQSVE